MILLAWVFVFVLTVISPSRNFNDGYRPEAGPENPKPPQGGSGVCPKERNRYDEEKRPG